MDDDRYNINRYYNSQSDYNDDENRRRHIEHENDFLHSSSGSYYIKWNDKRNSELYQFRMEILNNIKLLFLSKKIIYNIILSLILSLLTFPLKLLYFGVLGYMSLNIIVMVVYYILFPKTKVRSEITREQSIWGSAREKAYRK